MTHKAAQTWQSNQLTRLWSHPRFDPGEPDQFEKLRSEFRLGRIIFDDPEVDDFIHILPAPVFDFFQHLHKDHPDWRNLPRSERRGIYFGLRDDIPSRKINNFDSFDEMMRIDLDALDPVQVNFDAIPFGFDNTPTGIYRREHGKLYYVGAKPWIAETGAHQTVLTTEVAVLEATKMAIRKLQQKGKTIRDPLALRLDEVPPIFPVRVPLVLDRRAGANRPDGERVSALTREILSANKDALVIADGTRDVEGSISFQGMKGRNDFQEKDVYIVITSLAPEKYAELNVIGQWLEIPSIIGMHYQDQLNQAVGRNNGFRKSTTRETKTVVISSTRLWNSVLRKLQTGAPRVQLYLSNDKFW
jgi:hypothetical protein